MAKTKELSQSYMLSAGIPPVVNNEIDDIKSEIQRVNNDLDSRISIIAKEGQSTKNRSVNNLNRIRSIEKDLNIVSDTTAENMHNIKLIEDALSDHIKTSKRFMKTLVCGIIAAFSIEFMLIVIVMVAHLHI